VVRSAAGAHLKIPIEENITWDILHNLMPKASQVVIADLLAKEEKRKVTVENGAEKLIHLEKASRDFHFQNLEVFPIV